MDWRIGLVAMGLLGCAPDDTGDTDDTDEVPLIGEALACGATGPAGGLGGGTDLQRYDLDPDDFPDALCNDGTPGFFYYRPYDGVENTNRWVIQLQGGGSCESPAQCMARWCSVDTEFGMQGMTALESPPTGIRGWGILDRNIATNPVGGFNHVLIRYCSSDNWNGSARDVVMTGPHPTSGDDVTTRMHFLGAPIVEAVLETLRHDGVAGPVYSLGGGADVPMPDLDAAAQVLLAGGSAGGSGATWNADRVGDALRADNDACQGATCDLEYRVVVDSIFGPDRSQLDFAHTQQCTALELCDYESFLTAMRDEGTFAWRGERDDTSCGSFHAGDGEQWRCADEGHVLRHHLTTPMFVRIGQGDDNVGNIYVGGGYWADGEPIDQAKYAEIVVEELIGLGNPADAEEASAIDVAPGAYSPTCTHHEAIAHTAAVFDTTIDVAGTPTTMFMALAAWRAGPGPVTVIATGPSDNFCPPD